MDAQVKVLSDPEQVEAVNGIWELLDLLEKDTSAPALRALTHKDGVLLSAYELRKVRNALKQEWQAKKPKTHHNDCDDCEECLC